MVVNHPPSLYDISLPFTNLYFPSKVRENPKKYPRNKSKPPETHRSLTPNSFRREGISPWYRALYPSSRPNTSNFASLSHATLMVSLRSILQPTYSTGRLKEDINSLRYKHSPRSNYPQHNTSNTQSYISYIYQTPNLHTIHRYIHHYHTHPPPTNLTPKKENHHTLPPTWTPIPNSHSPSGHATYRPTHRPCRQPEKKQTSSNFQLG
jgi:hypothetical protein